MKVILALASLSLLVAATGCRVEAGYGGGYGVADEYPQTYYAPVYTAPAYYGPAYDRDHYFDRRHYWDRHRYYHHDRD